MNEKEKIIIGLSGGVDSAVSSYLIKRDGKYEISAVFMQNWDDFLGGNRLGSQKCTQIQDWEDALEVAKLLNIKARRISFVGEYWDKVFLDFLSKLRQGITPNPDITCNRIIKFSYFVNYAKHELKADYIATGHYARIIFDQNTKTHYLAKCKDQRKDQTYFLCQIDFTILPFLIFPLSNLDKKEVREIAESISLPNSQKKDSTGICFIGESNFGNFLTNYLEKKPGAIVAVENLKVVGQHNSALFFTIGQRKGLGLGSEEGPHYVVGKDVEKNILYVTSSSKSDWLYNNECFVKDVNWLVNEWEVSEIPNREITAKFRHRQKEVAVKLEFLGAKKDQLKVFFALAMRAVTPGQYAVFYDGEICLGGGMIFSTDKVDNHSRPILS